MLFMYPGWNSLEKEIGQSIWEVPDKNIRNKTNQNEIKRNFLYIDDLNSKNKNIFGVKHVVFFGGRVSLTSS